MIKNLITCLLFLSVVNAKALTLDGSLTYTDSIPTFIIETIDTNYKESKASVRDDDEWVEIVKKRAALAKAGDVDALHQIVTHYYFGIGVEKSLDKAIFFAKDWDFSQAIAKASISGINPSYAEDILSKFEPSSLVALIGLNFIEKASNVEAYKYTKVSKPDLIQLLISNGEKGDPVANYFYYLHQQKEWKNREIAHTMLKKSADNGLRVAQYKYAVLVRDTDPETSFKYFEMAAKNGYRKAFSPYGIRLYDQKKYKESLLWLTRAVAFEGITPIYHEVPERNSYTEAHLDAQYRLYNIYNKGLGIPSDKDYAEQIRLEFTPFVYYRLYKYETGQSKLHKDGYKYDVFDDWYKERIDKYKWMKRELDPYGYIIDSFNKGAYFK